MADLLPPLEESLSGTAQPRRGPRVVDASEAMAARHQRMLQELAEIGMELARVVLSAAREQAAAGDEAGLKTDVGDPALVFSRISRAVRQTLALEAKVVEDRLHRERMADAYYDQRKAEAARRAVRRKDEVKGLVEEAIEADFEGSDAERLLADLHERLDDPADDADFGHRPLGVLIARICRDLGVTPDWSLWEDEDWAIEEAAARPRGSPFAAAPAAGAPSRQWERPPSREPWPDPVPDAPVEGPPPLPHRGREWPPP